MQVELLILLVEEEIFGRHSKYDQVRMRILKRHGPMMIDHVCAIDGTNQPRPFMGWECTF
eukprot:c40824_g1_i1 orf=138-317(+)